MARRRHHEEHQNHEAWAIPYGDLITLLLAFFVVMYAISSVNEGKYRVLSDSLVAAFRGTPRSMQPVQVGEKQAASGSNAEMSVLQQAMREGQPGELVRPIRVGDERTAAESSPHAQPQPRTELGRVADEVELAMSDLIRADLVVVRRNSTSVEVEIRTDILFASGAAELSAGATRALEQLAAALKPFPNQIRVEGHTDNVPIRNASFRSNWELSAARAASVVHLLADRGVASSQLAVIGLSEFRPIQTNATAAGRNANRRVVVIILGADHASDPAAAPQAADGPPISGGDSDPPSPAVPTRGTAQ